MYWIKLVKEVALNKKKKERKQGQKRRAREAKRAKDLRGVVLIQSVARGMLARALAFRRKPEAIEASPSSHATKADEWECPVCLEHSNERVATNCGHVFCCKCSETLTDTCYVCQGAMSLKIRLYL